MKNKFVAYVILLLPFLSCGSNEAVSEETIDNEIQDVVVKNGNSLLWKIEGNGIKTSYFFGTMHMINEEYYHFSENLKERIAQSDKVIMEVNGIPNPITTFQLMSLDSGTVHDYFTSEQLVKLLEFMDKEMGIPPKEFDAMYGGMKPFFILQTITQNYFEPTAKSYDLDIMEITAAQDIPIVGLETIEEQLGFFDEIPRDKMAEMVMEDVENQEKEANEMVKLMEYYSEEKVDKLVPLLQKKSPEIMEFSDIFLYDRNKNWVPKIEAEMQENSCFLAVGAGHLFGDGGLIDLFEQKGYTITAISSK